MTNPLSDQEIEQSPRSWLPWFSHLLPYTVIWTDGRHIWEHFPTRRYPTAALARHRASKLNMAASVRVIPERERQRKAGLMPLWQWAEVRHVGRRAA